MKCYSIIYLEVDCDKLQIYTINPKASTKIIKTNTCSQVANQRVKMEL